MSIVKQISYMCNSLECRIARCLPYVRHRPSMPYYLRLSRALSSLDVAWSLRYVPQCSME